MSLPYSTLTPILGEQATEYTPESETTPSFMNGKFNELLANDKKLDEQINVLSKSGYSAEGQNKIIPNVLFIGGDYNLGKWGCISGQTVGMPSGVGVATRETLAYDVNNIQIRLTEHYPVAGRIWINSCKNATAWTGWATLVTDEQLNERGYLTTKQLANIDTHTVTSNGIYKIDSSCTNTPFSGAWGYMLPILNYDGYCVQKFIAYDGTEYNISQINGVWQSNYKKTATTETYDVPAPLSNGWNSIGGNTDYLPKITKVGNLCTITNGMLTSGSITNYAVIFTLPSWLTPSSNQLCYVKGNNHKHYGITIFADGNVAVDNNTGAPWDVTGIVLDFNGISWRV